MDRFFDLYLKGAASVAILYIAFNPIFRYHPSARGENLVIVILFTIVNLCFVGNYHYLAYGIVVGGLALLLIASKLVLAKHKQALIVLFSFAKADREMLHNTVSDTMTAVNISARELTEIRKFPFLLHLERQDQATVKSFRKKLDANLEACPKRFGYYHYFHIVGALILMAAIWRF